MLVLSVALVFAELPVFIHESAPQGLHALTPNADQVVTYTAAGFTPNVLSVPLGTRITFKNATNETMWPEADPYPSRSDYPEFNAGKEYGPGESFVFQFDREGTYGFHDRQHPSQVGTIQITDPRRAVVDISKTLEGQVAIRDTFLAMLTPGQPASIFSIIDLIEADPKLALNCHEIAHDLGHRAYELYGFSGAMNFTDAGRLDSASVQDVCAGGYVHGILEEAALHQSDFEENPGRMCESVPKASRASCFHGIGHALMFSNYRDTAPALASCRKSGTAADASRCFEGIWMEFFWGSTKYTGPDSLGWDPADPLKSCVETAEDAKPACFIYSAFGYLRNHPKDYAGAIKLCVHPGMRERDSEFCLKGVGITMISHFKAKHLEQSETFVAGLPYLQKYGFYQGVIGYGLLSGIPRAELKATCALFVNDSAICTSVLANTL